MTHPGLFLIVARADDGTIGHAGAMPWHIPADLKRFKALTMGPDGRGRPMIMGRKTFQSLPGLLPGRRHIVLTRDRAFAPADAEVAHDVASALAMAGPAGAAIIGGAEILALFDPLAERYELTEVHAHFGGDTRIPPPGPEWRESGRAAHPAEGGRPAFDFVTLEKAGDGAGA